MRTDCFRPALVWCACRDSAPAVTEQPACRPLPTSPRRREFVESAIRALDPGAAGEPGSAIPGHDTVVVHYTG